jgi:hypothetical protein
MLERTKREEALGCSMLVASIVYEIRSELGRFYSVDWADEPEPRKLEKLRAA